MARLSSRTTCRQLFKELKILTLASLYIFEVTCFVRKCCQTLKKNFMVHKYNKRRNLDIDVKKHRNVKKKSVIKMGTKMYNNLPKVLKRNGQL